MPILSQYPPHSELQKSNAGKPLKVQGYMDYPHYVQHVFVSVSPILPASIYRELPLVVRNRVNKSMLTQR